MLVVELNLHTGIIGGNNQTSLLGNKMVSKLAVHFYRFWHGSLKLKGAGFLLKALTRHLPGLQRFPIKLPQGQTILVDCRDDSAYYWLNFLLGERYVEFGLLQALLAV